MGGQYSTDFEMSPITNLSLLLPALLLLTFGKGEGKGCCEEKKVGTISYTLVPHHDHAKLPPQCLNNCIYTVEGSATPKFCFEKGDLPTECLSDTTTTTTTTTTPITKPTTTTTTTTTTAPVRLEVAVKEANFDPVPNARVILMLGDKGMTVTTDSNGRAPFALSSDMLKMVKNREKATIDVSATYYYSTTVDKLIDPDLEFQVITITMFPSQ